MYISQSEGANWGFSVLTDLKSRCVKYILIACTDNLTCFSDAINIVFPEREVQACIIHRLVSLMPCSVFQSITSTNNLIYKFQNHY